MLIKNTPFCVVVLASGLLLTAQSAHAQTAACCVADQCQELELIYCGGSGGDWLGSLDPPVTDCSGDPCLTGGCCTETGCDPSADTLAECDAIGGEYHGGTPCSASPCICAFEDVDYCQRGGLLCDPWPCQSLSHRPSGVHVADDFRPSADVINRICFEFAFSTEHPPPECTDDPPIDDFHLHFYEDAFGLPGTELPDTIATGGTLDIDRAKPTYDGWSLSAPVGMGSGVAVDPGECYWIEITGGSEDCLTHWPWSVDGNSYAISVTGTGYDVLSWDMNFFMN